MRTATIDAPAPRILVVDDDLDLLTQIASYLRHEGFDVEQARDAREMDRVLEASRFDVVVLDVMLPGEDGLSICARLNRPNAPAVVMLSALSEDVDRIVGLELGADDYIGKPFSPREVVARVKTVLRRSRRSAAPAEAVATGPPPDLEIDRTGHEVRVSGKPVALTPMEFRILDALAREPGRAFTREQLLDRISTDVGAVFDRTLDRHVANLRHKIEREPSRPRYILTVFGVGYKFVA